MNDYAWGAYVATDGFKGDGKDAAATPHTLSELLKVSDFFEHVAGPPAPNAIKCSVETYRYLLGVLTSYDKHLRVIPKAAHFIGIAVFEDNSLPFLAYEIGFNAGGKFTQNR